MFGNYLKLWVRLASLSAESFLANRIDSAAYLVGKLVRFGFFLVMFFSIFHFTDSFAGYGKYETLLFFLVFNFMDVFAQILFRGIYSFRDEVKQGSFDFSLIKPVNSLFLALTRTTDPLDAIFLLPIIALLFWDAGKLSHAVSFFDAIFFISLVIICQFIILAIHIFAACATVRTAETENLIWVYRESMTMARVPSETYPAILSAVFTYILPTLLVVSFPSKALIGQLAPSGFITAAMVAAIFFFASLKTWKFSLKKYSSASS
jgi:ABC-2 type transport system permease protein